MSERLPRSHASGEDPLVERLGALRTDVDLLRLAPPRDVRHRGDVRRRRQAAVTGLAALVVVGSGAGIAWRTVGGADERPQMSIATAPKASQTPSASTLATALDPQQAARTALLPGSALSRDATAEDTFPKTDLNPCRFDNDQPTDAVQWRVLASPSGAEVHQRVIVWPDARTATSHWDTLHQDLLRCPAASGRYGALQVSPMPAPAVAGDQVQGWAAEMPAGAAPTQVYAAAFVDGRVTSEVYFTDRSAPKGSESVRQSTFRMLAGEAAKRLILAVLGPQPVQPPSGAEGPTASSPDALLTAADVDPANRQWRRSSTYAGDGPSALFACQRAGFTASAATSVAAREFGAPDGARAVSLVATFRDEKAAVAALDAVVGSADLCSAMLAQRPQPGATVSDLSAQAPGADVAYVASWPVGTGEGRFEYVAAGHRGATVALVVMEHGGQESNAGVPPTTPMLQRALARLG